MSSGELRKYEYLTGDNLRYKPSIIEQAKLDYFPLGKIFTKGLDKENKEEGLFKRLKNIEDKNEQLLKPSISVNKGKTAKDEGDFSFDYAFYSFYRDFNKFKEMVSAGSKHGELKEFSELLSSFLKT